MLLLALIAVLALSGGSSSEPTAMTAVATPTPTPSPLSKDVRKEATAAGFGKIAERLARASQGAAMIQPGRPVRPPSTMGTSRFGGDPDLPTNARWPQCKGNPQTFLGQVRVKDLPPEAQDLRRLGGTIAFFTHVEFEPGETEYGLWAGDCSTVIHARKGTTLRRFRAPSSGVLALASAPMTFTGRPDVPETAGDKLLPPLQAVDMPDWERWSEFRDGLLGRIWPGHKLLGYHVEPNGGDDCSARAERPKDTWRHLFTVDSDDDLRFNVADAGRIQLFIAPADLAKGRFDRVCGVFDSA